MSKLPKMPCGDSIGKTVQVRFGGLRHHVNCGDGEFFDMENLSAENYPVLSVRKRRGRLEQTVTDSTVQIYADNGMFLTVDQSGVYCDGNQVAVPQDYENTVFIRFGDRVVMMPDKKILNMKYRILQWYESQPEQPPENPELYDAYAAKWLGNYHVYVWSGEEWADNGAFVRDIETKVTIPKWEGEDNERAFGYSVTVTSAPPDGWMEDGTQIGEMGVNNALYVPLQVDQLGFQKGDGVTISGLTKIESNNKTAVLRGIVPEIGLGSYLIFSDYCFTLPENAESYEETTEKGEITIRRDMPDMEVIFEHENRLWGAKGKEIFASKLGDPYNWNVFDGLSTDSYYLQTQEKGEITAGISFGYPRFFREDSMTTIYGAMPSAFQTQVTALMGVKKGEQRSLERVGGALLWLSNKGIVLYDGETTYLQDQVFGDWKLSEMIAKADAAKCYVHADIGPDPGSEEGRLTALFCYDTTKGVWTKEQDPAIRSMTYMDGVIYAINGGGQVILLDNEGSLSGDAPRIYSCAEFGDFTDGSPNRKAVSKLQLRLEVEEGASLTVKIQYDSSESWLTVKEIAAGKKRSVYLPVLPRRCDHYRIRLEGYGDWKLYSMARELYEGSAIH